MLLLLPTLALAEPGPLTEPEPPAELARLAGAWDWIGGAAEEAARIAAIDEVVALMPLLFRPFAHGRIADATPIAPRLCVRVDAARVAVGDCLSAIATPWDGAPWEHLATDGAREVITRRLDGSWLVERAAQANGAGTAAWRASRDATIVTARFTVESDQLPGVIRYGATYRRAP